MKRQGISVILPVCNAAATLSKCLESLLGQHILEVIAVDAMSSDSSPAILQSFRERLPLTILRGPDRGVYEGINKGIRMARGEWIYCLGADDSVLPGSLEKLAAAAGEDCDLVYGDVIRMPSGRHYDGGFDLKKLFERNICHQAMLIRYSLFMKEGLYNEDYSSLSDYAFNIRVFSKGYRCLYVPCLVARFNETGLSSSDYDFRFWSDFKVNLIRPFSPIIERKRLYGKLWKLFSFTLYGKKQVFRALYLWVYISRGQRSLRESLGQCRELFRKLFRLVKSGF